MRCCCTVWVHYALGAPLLQEGHYGLTLRATDVAGLVNQTNELDIWVDFTPPVITISGPARWVARRVEGGREGGMRICKEG